MNRRLFLGLLARPLLGSAPGRALSFQDQHFLDDLAKRSVSYFVEHASPITGMVRDRAPNVTSNPAHPNHSPASIGATGFCLAALCVGADRGYIPAEAARKQVLRTLRYFANDAYQNHGWFYHFMNAETGERAIRSEISSVDTAWLVSGMLTAKQYFRNDPEIGRFADLVYRRLDFHWMLNGDKHLLSHGWRPETGFLTSRWDTYSEHMLLYLLGLGSPGYPLRPESWYAWARPEVTYGQHRYISGGTLFTHQYSHAWVDFRSRREATPKKTNWFENSVLATRANRELCLSLGERLGYSNEAWGVTASDSANGYRDWGGPGSASALDGTVVPSAAAGSLMFAPDICLPALRAMSVKYTRRLYHRYGFSDAFNVRTDWTDSEVLGIDLGITMLSAENLRTGNLWRWFMANPELPKAMDLARLETV